MGGGVRNNHYHYLESYNFSLIHLGNLSGLNMFIRCQANLSLVFVHSTSVQTFLKHLLGTRLCMRQ